MADTVRWELLNLGWFSRNFFWGEADDRPMRGALCVSTFVEINGIRLVIDPGSREIDTWLFNRTGIPADRIDAVYVTHSHADHFIGLDLFPNAKLICAPGDHSRIFAQLCEEGFARSLFSEPDQLARKLQPSGDEIIPGVHLLPLPGHTKGLAGAFFQAQDGVVAVAGDAVMTRDFYTHRKGYYNSEDFSLSEQSIIRLESLADWIVPGHGNYFRATPHADA